MVAYNDKKNSVVTVEQALVELDRLRENWSKLDQKTRDYGLDYVAKVMASASSDKGKDALTAKAGNPNVTPNMFFAEVDRMMGHWDSMQPNIQKEAMLAVANMAVASSEHGSELAKLRTEAKFAALQPLVDFQKNVLSAISSSNAAVVAGAKKMAEGAMWIAQGVEDVANRVYKQGLEKIEKGLVLCAEGATMVAATLTVGYTAALVGVEGAAATVVKALDSFAASCTKAIAAVKAIDVNAMSHEQIMNAVTNAVAPVTRFLDSFAKSAYASLEQSAVGGAFKMGAVVSGATLGSVYNAAANAFTKEAVTATLGSVYNAAAAAFTSLVNGFDAASRGMDLGSPVQAQSAAKSVSDLSNTLEAHVNDPAHRDVMQRATNALSDLSGKLTDSKSADLAAKVDQAALKDVSAAFVDAVNSVQQDGQMASLNQNEVQAAQGQQQGGGRGR